MNKALEKPDSTVLVFLAERHACIAATKAVSIL